MAGKKHVKYSDEEIIEALQRTKGIISAAARLLSGSSGGPCDRGGLMNRIKKSKRLLKALEDIEEEALDFVESKLLTLLAEGDKSAIFFYLKCKGKHRGWIERQEVTGKDGGPVQTGEVVILELPDNGRGSGEGRKGKAV